MKKLLILLWFYIVSVNSFAQKEITWYTLSDVKWKMEYVKSAKNFFQMPRFGKNLIALDSTEINIKGFYIPVSADGSLSVVSAKPSSACFFCGTGGVESVIEIVADANTRRFKHLKTDEYIEVTGTLKLNKTDQEHLMYILENAKLLNIID